MAITSWMSWVRWRAAWLDSSPMITRMLASVLPASVSRRQTSLVSSVPESTSLDATKAWLSGRFSRFTGWRLT
ncbi:hypothetical protein D3C72_2019830 [compost metagenome]